MFPKVECVGKKSSCFEKEDDGERPLRMLQFSETRFLSRYNCFARMSRLKSYIQSIYDTTEKEWESLDASLPFFELLHKYTEGVKKSPLSVFVPIRHSAQLSKSE